MNTKNQNNMTDEKFQELFKKWKQIKPSKLDGQLKQEYDMFASMVAQFPQGEEKEAFELDQEFVELLLEQIEEMQPEAIGKTVKETKKQEPSQKKKSPGRPKKDKSQKKTVKSQQEKKTGTKTETQKTQQKKEQQKTEKKKDQSKTVKIKDVDPDKYKNEVENILEREHYKVTFTKNKQGKKVQVRTKRPDKEILKEKLESVYTTITKDVVDSEEDKEKYKDDINLIKDIKSEMQNLVKKLDTTFNNHKTEQLKQILDNLKELSK